MRQAALFAEVEGPRTLVNELGDVRFFPQFLDAATAAALTEELRATTHFVADSRLMYGRRVAVPRETASRGEGSDQPWSPRLIAVRRRVEELLATEFDYVFVNRYRDGNDSVAWHGDHDGEDDPGRTVASLSLGATRAFDLRPKRASGLRPRQISVDVADGDLVVMAGLTQRYWEHRIRKDPHVHAERLNLTFRQRVSRPAPGAEPAPADG